MSTYMEHANGWKFDQPSFWTPGPKKRNWIQRLIFGDLVVWKYPLKIQSWQRVKIHKTWKAIKITADHVGLIMHASLNPRTDMEIIEIVMLESQITRPEIASQYKYLGAAEFKGNKYFIYTTKKSQ